ncbi:Hok/Gef family protein [Escherichia coli]
MVVPSSHGGYKHVTKYALAAVIVLCLTVLGFTLLVGIRCVSSPKGTNIEFKVVLAYEPKK